VESPAAWGTEAFLQRHFGSLAKEIRIQRRHFNFRYHSPDHWLDVFSTYYGPTLKAFQALDETDAQSLRDDILQLIGRYNRAGNGAMVVPSEYLEVVIKL
ncbi:MAG: SAM-dependent methyltransferase, partial [gamma proteobacterium symbiont of Ctena orbiculata]